MTIEKRSIVDGRFKSVRLRVSEISKTELFSTTNKTYFKKLRYKPQSIGIFALLIVSIIGLIIAGIAIASGNGGVDWPLKVFGVTLLWFIVFIGSGRLYFGTLYLFANAYVLALALFHLSIVYMLALDQIELPEWIVGPQSIWLEMGSWNVVLALCSFGIGITGALLIKRHNAITSDMRIYYTKNINRFLFSQAIGLGLAAIIFFVLALKSYGNIFAYSRAELFALTADSRGFGVFMMVIPGVVTLLALSAYTKGQKIFSYLLAGFIVIVIMLSGYRSAALFPLLIGAILWVKSGRRIPLIVATSGVIAILIAIAAIGIFRQMGAYGSLGSEDLVASYEKSNITDSFMEMGSTLTVSAEVLKRVPKSDSHTYGYSYWLSFTDMFPNIGFNPESSETRASKLAASTFSKDALTRMAPSDWLTYRLNRWKFDNGQGVGFSAVAEPYLNFGFPGVVVYFVLIGFILARLDQIDITCHPYYYLFFAAIFWAFIRTVRNDFGNFTKPLGFILIILLIWNIGLHFVGKRYRF